MKNISALILIVAMAMISCTKESKEEPYNPDGSPITQAQALEIVKEDIDEYDMVYVTSAIARKNMVLDIPMDGSRVVKVPCDSWIVAIDSDPLANGGQKWLYIYVDAYTGNADKESWEWGMPWQEGIEFICVKNTFAGITKSEMKISCNSYSYSLMESGDSMSNNWAVIISGGANPILNHERYWNNCSAMYKCLRNVYNYRRDRIFVIMSDGKSESLDQRHLISGAYRSSRRNTLFPCRS